MRRLVALVVALVALVGLLPLHRAQACENATVGEFPAVKQLHRAEEALEIGDVALARSLATELASGKVYLPFSMRSDLESRSHRIIAMSWIRDPNATPSEIERATESLRLGLMAREKPDAVRQAELGEAYARAGQDEAAYQMLRDLDEKDLIGSPYAYAALARVAEKRGEHVRAQTALKRCAEIAGASPICRGAYLKPPLLRGKLHGFVLPGVLAVIALVRRRRAKHAKHPWSTFGDNVFAAIVVATAAFVFAFAEEPWVTTLVTFLSLVFIAIAQRVAFVASVKRGGVAGWIMRDANAEDERLPVVRSFFHVGHHVIEREPDAAYRDPARVAVMRVSPRSAAARTLVVAAVVGIALLGACTTLTFSETRSAAQPSGAIR